MHLVGFIIRIIRNLCPLCVITSVNYGYIYVPQGGDSTNG